MHVDDIKKAQDLVKRRAAILDSIGGLAATPDKKGWRTARMTERADVTQQIRVSLILEMTSSQNVNVSQENPELQPIVEMLMMTLLRNELAEVEADLRDIGVDVQPIPADPAFAEVPEAK